MKQRVTQLQEQMNEALRTVLVAREEKTMRITASETQLEQLLKRVEEREKKLEPQPEETRGE
jgi:hypothetical protein